MFLIEPSWYMEDITDSKDGVYKVYWVPNGFVLLNT